MPPSLLIRYWIGIDIGANGGICVQDSQLNPIRTYGMPRIAEQLDPHGLNNLLSEWKGKNCHVLFEDLQSIYGSSAASNFTFGFNCAATEMCCIANNLPYTRIKAKDWQKELFRGVKEITKKAKTKSGEKRDTKAMALVAVKRLYPTLNLLDPSKPTSRVPHNGIVDAILISDFCKKHFK